MLQLQPAAADQHSQLIADLIREAFADQAQLLNLDPSKYPNFVGFETADRTHWRLNHGDTALLAFWQHQLIGTISYQAVTDTPGIGYIKRLAILPAYRGHNYGTLLMQYAEESLFLHGLNRAEISIVAEFNTLHRYYHSLGYLDGNLTAVPSLPFMVQYLYKPLK
ncbi:MAG: GNAT family N-acetyltransferase [Methylocystaceae bacterium]